MVVVMLAVVVTLPMHALLAAFDALRRLGRTR
jgi:hypothetical protein